MKVRFKSIVLFLPPLLILSIVTAELQGPLSTHNANSQDSLPQETTTSQPDKGAGKGGNSAELTDSNIVSNERKSAKYVTGSESPANAPVTQTPGNKVVQLSLSNFDNDVERFKIWQQALLDQQLHEKLIRQKLEDQISAIENSRKKPVAEPTPREIEGSKSKQLYLYIYACITVVISAQTFYENGMNIISKQPGAKYLAYKFLLSAAERNHLKARAELAWAHLLGRIEKLNFEFAATEFDELAKEGVPEANMVK